MILYLPFARLFLYLSIIISSSFFFTVSKPSIGSPVVNLMRMDWPRTATNERNPRLVQPKGDEDFFQDGKITV
jgi:hypothetical protein